VVALKGFDEEFYHRVLGIKLAPVLTAIEALARRSQCWLELVNLVVPTYNDDPEQIRAMVAWIREHAGPDVPLHFERFVPKYRLANLPRTPVQTLEAACEAGRAAGLRYVYTSNIVPRRRLQHGLRRVRHHSDRAPGLQDSHERPPARRLPEVSRPAAGRLALAEHRSQIPRCARNDAFYPAEPPECLARARWRARRESTLRKSPSTSSAASGWPATTAAFA
jgi:hypothetical protein